MKRTTKVLLPLGLCMSIVIPVTVKALFADSDFFRNDESSKIDYLQPYKVKPEASLDLPTSINNPVNDSEASYRVQKNTYEKASDKNKKLDLPNADISSNVELQLQMELQNQDDLESVAIPEPTNQ